MKPKALVFLLAFCLALGFLAANGLCTTAKKVSSEGREINHLTIQPIEDYNGQIN